MGEGEGEVSRAPAHGWQARDVGGLVLSGLGGSDEGRSTESAGVAEANWRRRAKRKRTSAVGRLGEA